MQEFPFFCRNRVCKKGVSNIVKNENTENKDLGFVIAIVFLIIGSILFIFWDSFGNEILIKLLSAPLVFFGLAGFGIEISNRSNDKGASNMGIGLAFIFLALIIKSALSITPNLIILFIVLIGMLFIGVSISSLIKSKQKIVNGGQLFYRIVTIIGQIVGSIVSILKLIELLL